MWRRWVTEGRPVTFKPAAPLPTTFHAAPNKKLICRVDDLKANLGKPGFSVLDVRSLVCIAERLVEAYQPERMYLFGSKARGDAGPDSDFDVMVMVPDAAPEERRDSALAYRVLRGTGIAADVLIWTLSRFERRQHVVASLPATVLREGRLLHAA